MGITVQQFVDTVKSTVDQMASTVGRAFSMMITHGNTFRHVIKNIFGDVLASFFSMISQMIARSLMFFALTGGLGLNVGTFSNFVFGRGFDKGGYTGDGAKDK